MFQIFQRCFLKITLRYVTLRYIMDQHVWINGMLRYVAVSYVTLREGGKPA